MTETPHGLTYQIETIPESFVAEDFLPALSATELGRYKKMKDELRKKQFLFGRFLIKQKVSTEILISPTGKPYVDSLLHVSISHSEEFCGVAVADRCVGIDLQKKRAIKNFDKTLKRICHKNEWTLIEQKSQTEKENLFFQLWTMKEAYSKCIGAGLQIQLAQQDFSKMLFSKENVKKLGSHTFFHSQEGAIHFAFCLNNEH